MKLRYLIPLSFMLTSPLIAEEYDSVEKAPKGKHKIGVYGWVPKVDADSTVDGGTAPIDLSAKDVLDNLSGAFSGRYEYLRHDKIGY
ncbi:hypothetical protein PQO01_02520 [Lentisphaera marina]|uniref:hypothetical protein n=1 Tax=Lentisphaera marina TaxID=1111041 RepID=UPI002366039D|nr:hypothetical protein [Lentisphaera marina]MDD7983821.1 hypothetical protein [Lentisphaera marina]